jgi:hypothetical protein
VQGFLAADPYAGAQVLAETTVREWNALKGTLV